MVFQWFSYGFLIVFLWLPMVSLLFSSGVPFSYGFLWFPYGLPWFSYGSRSRQNHSQKYRFDDFLALAPEVDKIIPEVVFWWLSGLGSRSQQNQSQKSWFNDFLALASEVDKTKPRKLDLMTFWPWLQMSRKPFQGSSIWWLSSLGSRSHQNQPIGSRNQQN